MGPRREFVRHHAKAPSAGSIRAGGNSRGLLRRAFATRGARNGSRGSGAPSPHRLRTPLALFAISLIALFATAASASAAPSVTIGAVSEGSYASAHVDGTVNANNEGFFSFRFEYSTDETNWISAGGTTPSGLGIFFGSADTPVKADLANLKGGTKYFVRLRASSNSSGEVTLSALPNPSFTTLPVDPPTIPGTVEASPVFSTSAKAIGKVKRPANPAEPKPGADDAFDVNCHFDYITDAQFQENITNIGLEAGFTGATPVPCTQNPIKQADAGIEKDVDADFPPGTLTPATTYHLRLVAENAAPGVAVKEAAGTFTTTAKVAGPSVTAVDDASEVKFNTATLTGKVLRPDGDDPALNVKCHFEYITDAQFLANEGASEPVFTGAQTADCEQNTITSAGEPMVSAKAGLVATTKYHLRLVAENKGGSDAKNAANTFTTPEAELPTVTIDPVAGGTFTTAHVSGKAIPDVPGRFVRPFVEISTDNANWGIFEAPSGGIAGTEPKHDYTGLSPSTTYFFRICATYNGGLPYDQVLANGEVACSPEPNPEITTEPATEPATAENLAVTNVTATSAHFSGTVNPNAPAGPLSPAAKKAYETKWHFECTPECKDANENVIGGTVQGEEGAQTVTGDVKRLEPGTAYTVTLVAHSEGGDGTDTETFPTLKIPPSVKQSPGAPDGEGGYTLQGVVNPNKETITACEFKWGPNAPAYAFSAPCSPLPSPGAKPTTVEAHLTSLNPDVDYHALLVVTYGAGLKADSGEDQTFKATFAAKEPCPANEQQRAENSSLALPECRAYEMVSPPGKEGFDAGLTTYDGGTRVAYLSGAGNIAKSGQNAGNARNFYVAERSATGWKTIPNLNGSSGSFFDAPSYVELDGISSASIIGYSPNLLSSVWYLSRKGNCHRCQYLRSPDGTFALIGSAKAVGSSGAATVSADLTHLATWSLGIPSEWGPGVYEFVGTGMDQPRRVDVDNSGTPISDCILGNGTFGSWNAKGNMISADGRTLVFEVGGGCGGATPPANELWARVNGTTSIDVSASHCSRLDCNAPAKPTFVAATLDGSRVFFTTTQQLVDGDTDQTNDIYACDIPAGNPAPSADKANHCAAFRQVSAGAQTGASVESVDATSEDGTTVFFTAKGSLADNEDALGEEAVDGDHNLYLWRTDASHPDGQTTFVARLDSNDLSSGGFGQVPQTTLDGRYLVFTTTSQLLDTDTDTARDVYRYDTDTGELTRVSTNVFGVAGNGGFPAAIAAPTEHHPSATISDDGQKIVFTTTEALSPADGNAEPDVYLWTPSRISLISTGSSGSAPRDSLSGSVLTPKVAIDPSGEDIYFESAQPLTPADPDDSTDVYDARIGGGFSFAQAAPCSGAGGACQSHSPGPVPSPAPATAQPPDDPGNVQPCPKGKVRKGNKCVKKKKPKKHSGKKNHGKKASHMQGGGK
jgi:hypothetical protein